MTMSLDPEGDPEQGIGRNGTRFEDLREASLPTEAVDFAHPAQSSDEPGLRTAPEVSRKESFSDPRRQIDINDQGDSVRARNSSESWYAYQSLNSNANRNAAEPKLARGQNTSPRQKESFESFVGKSPSTRNPEFTQSTVPRSLQKSDSSSGPKRASTTLIRDPNTTINQDDAVGLDAGEPGNIGQWAVDQHLDGLLREIVDDSAGGFVWKFLGLGSGENKLFCRNKKTNHPDQRLFRVNFADLQRIHLRKLQVKLVTHAVYMHEKRTEPGEQWEQDLADYIQALKDYDYMTESTSLPQDYFLATGERRVDRDVIKEVIDKRVGGSHRLRETKKTTPVEKMSAENIPIGGTRNVKTRLKKLQNLRNRIILAALGAFLMLGPMWLMVLHQTMYTGLITTTMCVSAFGLVASWMLAEPKDVLSATAAYAAVLVVFVGLTTSK